MTHQARMTQAHILVNNVWSVLPGLLLSLAVAAIAMGLSTSTWAQHLGLSTMSLAIVLGMLLGNTIYPSLQPSCQKGVSYSKTTLLRAGIVLYGMRLTFQQLLGVGTTGLLSAAVMLVTTFILAQWLGRWLRIDRETRTLIGAGSSICGAAAVLATEPVVRAKAEQVTVAVATVVLYGTVALFFYPWLNVVHLWPFSGQAFGVYIGSSVHEVAQVVAAGKAIGPIVADAAVTTKMIRVILLAPFLLLLSWWWELKHQSSSDSAPELQIKRPLNIPWFAFGFIAVALFNSLHLLPAAAVSTLLNVCTVLLTMAMGALGLTTHFRTLQQAGVKPLVLAGLLMLWLVCGGGVLQVFLATLR